MSYRFLPGKMYRMPTHFGPATGPRQGENGRKFANVDSPKTQSWYVRFVTNPLQLEALIPEGMGLELGEDPIVTVVAQYHREIEWLAGRGYNTLGVTFPVVYNGKQDHISGEFLIVLWENLCDPIVTGREELGFSKIYCELPEPRVYDGGAHCTASWMGFQFMDLRLGNLESVPVAAPKPSTDEPSDGGTIHLKYIPRTGEWGTADVCHLTLSPTTGWNAVTQERWRGEGSVEFHRATWEDMPTQFQIVNALQDLEIREYREAGMSREMGSKDLSDQRILR